MSYLSALEKLRDLGLHGMVITRNGEPLCEARVAPYRLDLPHIAFSMTKSFTSTAVGIAIEEGLLSLDDRVVSFFPELLPSRPCENMEAMTIRHLLMMATGHTSEPFFWPHETEPLPNFLRSYVEAQPGSSFLYNTAGSCVLAYILEKVTGVSLDSYLRPRLLEPLGINEWYWERFPDGTVTGGFGISIKTRDIVKFGNFLLSEGRCGAAQLVSREWIREATSKKITQPGPPDSHWTSGYGYQFWLNVRENSYRADGAFGQFCIVIPHRKLVIGANSGSQDMDAMLTVIFNELLPSLDGIVPETTELQLEPPQGAPVFPAKRYNLSKNRYGYESIAFTGSDEVDIVINGKEYFCRFGRGSWRETEFQGLIGSPYNTVTIAAGVEDGDPLLRVLYTQTPFVDDWRMRFHGDDVIIHHRRNVGFESELDTTIFGICED